MKWLIIVLACLFDFGSSTKSPVGLRRVAPEWQEPFHFDSSLWKSMVMEADSEDNATSSHTHSYIVSWKNKTLQVLEDELNLKPLNLSFRPHKAKPSEAEDEVEHGVVFESSLFIQLRPDNISALNSVFDALFGEEDSLDGSDCTSLYCTLVRNLLKSVHNVSLWGNAKNSSISN